MTKTNSTAHRITAAKLEVAASNPDAHAAVTMLRGRPFRVMAIFTDRDEAERFAAEGRVRWSVSMHVVSCADVLAAA